MTAGDGMTQAEREAWQRALAARQAPARSQPRREPRGGHRSGTVRARPLGRNRNGAWSRQGP